MISKYSHSVPVEVVSHHYPPYHPSTEQSVKGHTHHSLWWKFAVLILSPNRRWFPFSPLVQSPHKSQNQWWLDVLYHRAWYSLDWCHCVLGQGCHAGTWTATLLRSRREWYSNLKLQHFGLHHRASVCTFSKHIMIVTNASVVLAYIWVRILLQIFIYLCLYEQVFAKSCKYRACLHSHRAAW